MSAADENASDENAPGGGDPPHYLAHRKRLRARASRGELSALPDYELLELQLFRTLPRGDVKPLAKILLRRFRSYGGVVSASLDELRAVQGVGEAVALDLKIVHEAALRMTREAIDARPVISSSSALQTYLRTRLQHDTRERFIVLYLDKRNQLLRDETMTHGTVDQAAVYPREIVRLAIELSASAVILVHNHPSGDPSPSRADVEMTRDVIKAAGVMNISVHDHLIVGRDGVASFKALGLI